MSDMSPQRPLRPLLPGALDAIADGAARAHEVRALSGGGLALDDVRAAARRRRLRFGAGVGLAAAAVVGAVALGGAALTGGHRAAPPVDSPAPTPDDVWAGGGCGVDLGDLAQPSGAPDVTVEIEPTAPDFDASQRLTATMSVHLGAGTGVGHGYWSVVVLAQDGVVVGVPTGPWYAAAGDSAPADDPSRLVGAASARFVGCAGDEPGSALLPGDYDLVAIVGGVELADGGTWPVPFVSEPAPVRAGPVDDASGWELPGCGASMSGRAVGGSQQFPSEVRVRVGRIDDAGVFVHDGVGDALGVEIGVTNTAADLYDGLGLQVRGIVTRGDDEVVAELYGGHTDPPPVDWPQGTTRTSGVTGVLETCDGSPLPPGEYILWTVLRTSAATSAGVPPLTFDIPVEWVRFRVYAPGDPAMYGPVTYLASPGTGSVEDGWTDVDASQVPSAVPLGLSPGDTVNRVQAYEDGRRWKVEIWFTDGSEDQFADITAALQGAGFAGPARSQDIGEPAPGSGIGVGVFSTADYRVEVVTEPGGDGINGGWILIVRTS